MEDDNSTKRKVIHAVQRISFLKTAYFSLKCRGLILVGRGSWVHLDKGARMIVKNRGMLVLGLDYDQRYGSSIHIKKNGLLEIGGRVHLMKGCTVRVGPKAILKIGDGSAINENTKIICKTRIVIGEHCGIGWNNNLLDSDMHYLVHKGKKREFNAPITIGNKVWTGFSVSILKGASVGDHAVIGANSMVTKLIPPHTLSVGIPSKVVAEDIDWDT